MKICDRCGSKSGVNQHIMAIGMRYESNGKMEIAYERPSTADLCSMCVGWLKEYGVARMWWKFIHEPSEQFLKQEVTQPE